MIKAFTDGRRKDFFVLWEKFLPETLRNTDPVAQKLEFYLQIYFAVYPLRNSLPWPLLSSRENQVYNLYIQQSTMREFLQNVLAF